MLPRDRDDAESKRQAVRTSEIPFVPTSFSRHASEWKSARDLWRCKRGTFNIRAGFLGDQTNNCPAGLRRLDVYRYDHSDYSDHCAAWRLQRRWRWSVLWHRLLWRRRPRADHHHHSDSRIAGADIDGHSGGARQAQARKSRAMKLWWAKAR